MVLSTFGEARVGSVPRRACAYETYRNYDKSGIPNLSPIQLKYRMSKVMSASEGLRVGLVMLILRRVHKNITLINDFPHGGTVDAFLLGCDTA
jgi:hypothetical protein